MGSFVFRMTRWNIWWLIWGPRYMRQWVGTSLDHEVRFMRILMKNMQRLWPGRITWTLFQYKGLWIPIIEKRLSHDRLIFIMEIIILKRRHLYIQTGPWIVGAIYYHPRQCAIDSQQLFVWHAYWHFPYTKTWHECGCYLYWNGHYNYVIMGVIASPITSLTIVYSTVYSDADQRKC